MLSKVLTPIQIILMFTWSGVCCIPTLILRFIFFNEKVFGFVIKYIWSPVLLLIAGTWVKSTGEENIPKERNFILASNHESLLDIPAMTMTCPTYLYFIAKKELAKVPFIGWGIWGAGMIFIDRKNKEKAMQSIKEAGEKATLKKKNIVSFPEGTRTKNDEIQMFRRGTFILSQQAKIDIVPCAVEGAREVWPSEKIWIKPGSKIKVAYGKPILVKDHLDKSVEDYAAFVREEVLKLHATLQS